jgi:hypothetical protein
MAGINTNPRTRNISQITAPSISLNSRSRRIEEYKHAAPTNATIAHHPITLKAVATKLVAQNNNNAPAIAVRRFAASVAL